MNKPTTEFANMACNLVVQNMVNEFLESFEPEERFEALTEINHSEVLRNMINDHHPMAKYREHMLSFFRQIMGTLLLSGKLNFAVKIDIECEGDEFNVEVECHIPSGTQEQKVAA